MFHGRERPCKHSYGASEIFGHYLSLVFTSKFIVLKYFDRSAFQVLTIYFSTIIREDFFSYRKRKRKIGEIEDQKRDKKKNVCINRKKKHPVGSGN